MSHATGFSPELGQSEDFSSDYKALYKKTSFEVKKEHEVPKMYPDYVLVPPKELWNTPVGYTLRITTESSSVSTDYTAKFNSKTGYRQSYDAASSSRKNVLGDVKGFQKPPTVFTDLYDNDAHKIYDSSVIFPKLHTMIPQSLNKGKTGPDKGQTVKDIFKLLALNDPYFQQYLLETHILFTHVSETGLLIPSGDFNKTEQQIITDYALYRNKANGSGFIFSYGAFNTPEYFHTAHIGSFPTGTNPSLQRLFGNTIDPQETVSYRRDENLGTDARFLEGHICVKNPDTTIIAGQMVYHYLNQRGILNKYRPEQKQTIKQIVELHHLIFTLKDGGKAKELVRFYLQADEKHHARDIPMRDALIKAYETTCTTQSSYQTVMDNYSREKANDAKLSVGDTPNAQLIAASNISLTLNDATVRNMICQSGGLMDQAKGILQTYHPR